MASPSTPTLELSKLSLGDYSGPPSPSGSKHELLSPPGTPTRPKRNPLRAQSHASLKDAAKRQAGVVDDGLAEIRVLHLEVSKLQDRMYEIQELRHSSSAPTERLNILLSSLTEQVEGLAPRMGVLLGEKGAAAAGPRADLKQEWDKLLQRQKVLGEEMKEDGWLIRFRTTADQAEAMMDPLQRSQTDLSTYLDRLSGTATQADPRGDLSVSGLDKLHKSHESLKSTYLPSINKILKMMDRSLHDRSTKNGEALRRYGDMETRWTALQRSLAQLDARVKLVISQCELDEGGDVEVLDDPTSPASTLGANEGDYHLKSKPHRLSVSSGSSFAGFSPRSNQSPRVMPSPAFSMAPGSLRRRPSTSSFVSSSTNRPQAEKPRWNVSTKVDHSPKNSLSTPARNTFGYTGHGSYGGIGRASSPTPSNMSGMTSVSRNMTGSRIPVATPRRVTSGVSSYGGPSPPGRSPTTPNSKLSVPSPLSTPAQPSMYRAPHTTHIPRQSLSRASTAPLAASAPRARPLRTTGPPSSFRPTTPSPFPPLPSSRPGSRMSMAGGSVSGRGGMASSVRGPAQDLRPFHPSKFDLLDQTVAAVIAEEGFDLFVARVDAPLQRGQRKAENEEWKGEFVFGAGEKMSPVKLLMLAGPRVGAGKEAGTGKRTKCLVRVAGMWVALADVLRERKARAGDVF